uniref:F-box domain-containing protein n=1 Tax=Culex tarsalis TaxID=7177 RepID=A0A1Q3EVC3_CULTA
MSDVQPRRSSRGFRAKECSPTLGNLYKAVLRLEKKIDSLDEKVNQLLSVGSSNNLCRGAAPKATPDDNNNLVRLDNCTGLQAAVAPLPSKEEPEYHLPDEIWVEVFRNLSDTQLMPVRLCCHHWMSLVDGSPALAGKFTVRFGPGFFAKQRVRPAHLYPKATRALMQEIVFNPGNLWWPGFGRSLVYLKLSKCSLLPQTLFEMLSETPHLRRLELCSGGYFDSRPSKVTFCLDKLKELVLHYQSVSDEVLERLGQGCPHLKVVSITRSICLDGDQLGGFLQKLQDTLESFEIDDKVALMDEILKCTRLNLKRLILKYENDYFINNIVRKLAEISRTQGSLEHLGGIPGTASTLRQIGTENPKLKHLQVRIQQFDYLSLSFLDVMPELEHLELDGSRLIRYLADFNVNKTTGGLLRYLHYVPKLRTFILQGSHRHTAFRSWSELFNSFQNNPHLQRMELTTLEVATEYNRFSHEFPSLRQLKIINCDVPAKSLTKLFGLCPALREVHLSNMRHFNDQVVLAVCLKLTQLRELTVEICPEVTDASVGHILKHRPGLEQLNVFRCLKLSQEAIEQLRAANGNWVIEK